MNTIIITKPNPGSREAIDMGCSCPVLDNSHGKGYMGLPNIFVYNLECPIHKHLHVEGGKDE